jgi:hypothetical protein
LHDQVQNFVPLNLVTQLFAPFLHLFDDLLLVSCQIEALTFFLILLYKSEQLFDIVTISVNDFSVLCHPKNEQFINVKTRKHLVDNGFSLYFVSLDAPFDEAIREYVLFRNACWFSILGK